MSSGLSSRRWGSRIKTSLVGYAICVTAHGFQAPLPRAVVPPTDRTLPTTTDNRIILHDIAETGSVRSGLTPPIPIAQPQPEYSEAARKAKLQGHVQIQVVVDDAGHPKDMRVIKKLGLGLDEKALEAVAKWTFKPGTKNGKPVSAMVVVDAAFLLPEPQAGKK